MKIHFILIAASMYFLVPALVPLEPKERNSPERPQVESLARPSLRDSYDFIKCEREPDCPVPTLPELTRRPFYLSGECLWRTGVNICL